MEIQLRVHHREYLPSLYDSLLFPSSFLRQVLFVSPENTYLLIELNYYLVIVFPLKIIWIFPLNTYSIYIYIVSESDTRNSLSTQAVRECRLFEKLILLISRSAKKRNKFLLETPMHPVPSEANLRLRKRQESHI